MPIAVPTTIATGFADAAGSAYRRSVDQLLISDSGVNTISALTVHSHAKAVVGTGYTSLRDIALSVDGLHAYVTDGASLLKLPLTNLNRPAATVVASGLGINLDQIALDEAHGYAYALGGGNLERINLATGAVTTVTTGLFNPRGILVTSDGRFAYISGDDDIIRRIDMQSHTNLPLVSGLGAPRHLTFTDASESVILFAVPNPSGAVMKLDLTTTPPTASVVAGPTAAMPYDVAVIAPDHVLVVCADVIQDISFTAGIYSAAGPVLLGIGFIPNDSTHIVGGYADTHADPGAIFNVRVCPFGGSLPLMINHDWARNHGANFYQIQITPAGGAPRTVTQSYSDYLWSTALNAFESTPVVPVSGFYRVHAAGAIWLNYWLGMILDSTSVPSGLLTIQVRLFAAESLASEIGHATDPGRSATLMIDNTLPTASLNKIWHDGAVVGTCGLVTTGSTQFTFDITAEAPKHLLAWNLTAYWGDNKSALVASDSYASHLAGGPIWQGLVTTVVPTPAWDCNNPTDPTSKHCGHSFFLYAWDRVINGWNYVHGAAGYQKTITILL